MRKKTAPLLRFEESVATSDTCELTELLGWTARRKLGMTTFEAIKRPVLRAREATLYADLAAPLSGLREDRSIPRPAPKRA